MFLICRNLVFRVLERLDMKEFFSELIANKQFSERTAWSRKRFKAGETILKKGEFGNTLFLLEEGTVRVLSDLEGAGCHRFEVGLCDLLPGTVFGEVCLYESVIRTASMVSVTDVCLLEIRGDMLSVYLDDHPVQGYLFLKKLFQTMSGRLGIANERLRDWLARGIDAHDVDEWL